MTAIKSFTQWLVRHGKLPRDPLMTVDKPKVKNHRQRVRRMILPDEWPRLHQATIHGPMRYGMSGPERALLYATAIQTGLRASELRSLTPASLHLDSTYGRPFIRCKASDTKNGHDARQYIQSDLANELRQHVESLPSGSRLFSMPSQDLQASMLREDVDAARHAWLDEVKSDAKQYAKRQASDFLQPTNHQGEILDFHGLRHTCGAWLARSGADPKAIQAIMRHSTITMTLDTYGHLFPGQEADAVAKLPAMLTSQKDEG